MRRGAAGFTLIELLVAITLAAGVTVATTLLARSALDYEKRQAEHWTNRAEIRDSHQLLEHYWGKRQKDKFTFTPARLLLYLRESGSLHFVGFSCSIREDGRHDFEFYRWPANDEETVRIQDGGAWPSAARQTLVPDLQKCGFTFLHPAPADAPEAPARWIADWTTRETPAAVRLDLVSPRGAHPPLIFQAPAL